MRLIDADKLMLSLADWMLQKAPIHTYEKPKEFTADEMHIMIWRTIRGCTGAVEEQPTVEAIPIEWVKKYIESHVFLFPELLEETLLKILEDWRKENE